MGQSSILGNNTWSSTHAPTFWRTLPPQFQDMTPPQSHILQKLLPLSLGQSALKMETADFSTLAPSLTNKVHVVTPSNFLTYLLRRKNLSPGNVDNAKLRFLCTDMKHPGKITSLHASTNHAQC